MRLIGRFVDQRQVSEFVDSARNIGLDRKDMIISDMADQKIWDSIEEAAENTILIKSETNAIGQAKPFSMGIKGLKGDTGILVAIKIPKHSSDRIRVLMEQNGAVEIIQD